jgi:hypothetical protein
MAAETSGMAADTSETQTRGHPERSLVASFLGDDKSSGICWKHIPSLKRPLRDASDGVPSGRLFQNEFLEEWDTPLISEVSAAICVSLSVWVSVVP